MGPLHRFLQGFGLFDGFLLTGFEINDILNALLQGFGFHGLLLPFRTITR
jgi:hypothetical protein